MITFRNGFGMAMCASIVLSLVLIGCRDQSGDKSPSQDGGATEQQYEITGDVVAIDPDAKTVTLDHEDIPGLMKGMEMEFTVKDPAILQGVQAGDHVQGRLVTKEGTYVITDLTKHER